MTIGSCSFESNRAVRTESRCDFSVIWDMLTLIDRCFWLKLGLPRNSIVNLFLPWVSEHAPFGLRSCTNISGCLPNLLWVEGGLSWSPRCQRGLTFDVCVESCDDRKAADSKLFDVGSSFACAWKWNSGAPVWIPTCEKIHVHLGSWYEYNRQ